MSGSVSERPRGHELLRTAEQPRTHAVASSSSRTGSADHHGHVGAHLARGTDILIVAVVFLQNWLQSLRP